LARTCPARDFVCRHLLSPSDPFFLARPNYECLDCARICVVCHERGHGARSQVPRAGRYELRGGRLMAHPHQRPLEAADFACPGHVFEPPFVGPLTAIFNALGRSRVHCCCMGPGGYMGGIGWAFRLLPVRMRPSASVSGRLASTSDVIWARGLPLCRHGLSATPHGSFQV